MGTKTRYAALFPSMPHVWWCNASGSLIDSVACNRFACPIDCKLSGWPGFSTCTQSCGTGSQYRTKSVLTPAADEHFKDAQKKAKQKRKRQPPLSRLNLEPKFGA